MQPVRLTVKNYRCFPDTHPLRLDIGPGFESFVGINNAGKSSILRLFWECGEIFSAWSRPADLQYAFRGGARDLQPRRAAGEEIASKLNDRPVSFTFEWDSVDDETGRMVDISVTAELSRGEDGKWILTAYEDGEPFDRKSSVDQVWLQAGERRLNLDPFVRACEFLAGGMYLGPFRNTINVGGSDAYYDIAVGAQFVHQFQAFKSGDTPSQNEAVYRLLQDVKRIFGFDHFDINATPNGDDLQVFIDGRSFRLAELGAGIAQFILVLANVLVRRPTVAFIDEPESHLHPTLQLDFLTTVASYCSEGSVMFATHNLGLARAASDRIYSCRRLALGMSDVQPLEATPHLAEFLGELGFSAYRDLGFDSVLLVEGSTEVKVMQQFLRKWQKDHQVVLLGLGGASMINAHSASELTEVARISPKVLAIIDSERPAADATLAADRQAFVKQCRELGIEILVLERRAIENYFSDAAIKRALGDSFSALQPYQLLKEAEQPWAKRENWRIAREMERTELEGTDLGSFLAAL